MFPERFNNKTNGVTPRRWLLTCNPGLAQLISEAIGDALDHRSVAVGTLAAARRDRAFRTPSSRQSARPRPRFVDWLKTATGEVVDPDTIFDSQIKRIHEYKRQLLNALHIVVLYNRLRDKSRSRVRAAHVLLRRQGGSGLCAGQADHQVHQQPGRHDQRGSRRATGA